jgi:hypothetical protein
VIARWFTASGLLNIYGLFGSAAGVIPAESGMRLSVMGAACFLVGAVSALWNTRKNPRQGDSS